MSQQLPYLQISKYVGKRRISLLRLRSQSDMLNDFWKCKTGVSMRRILLWILAFRWWSSICRAAVSSDSTLRSTSLGPAVPHQLDARDTILPNSTFNVENDNVPNDFELDIKYRDSAIFVASFWSSVINAIGEVALLPFLQTTEGYIAPDESVVALADSTQTPDLYFSHIVWSLQRIAEDQYRNKPYKELNAGIFVSSSGAAAEKTKVGQIGIRDVRPRIAPGDQNATNISSNGSFAGDSAPAGASNTTLHSSTGDSQQLQGSGMSYEIEALPDARFLRSIDLFIAIIRSIARLGETDYSQIITHFEYTDPEANIAITFSLDPGVRRLVTYEEVILVLKQMALNSLTKRIYLEISATFFKSSSRRRKNYGVIVVKKVDVQPGAGGAVE
ncbi:uncharacterized protein KY384_003946 [Bacidia gigantensis]|uniref:uncharacterized protein n=1 Tax=Bacidia gigantensis TaxID=2732470 RepID=UPI001D04EC01|nr:uncharacterized protein KY384_003946 [Bacidia gigantensis]KAG8532305.1 hypothetical protein KY384_003946 [Bacidia gigantensis]